MSPIGKLRRRQKPKPARVESRTRRKAKAVALSADVSAPAVETEWLDPGVPVGSLTLLAGKRELGKSLWIYGLAARLSRRSGLGGPVTSLLLVGEDPWETVAVPRLKAAGAKLEWIRLGKVEEGKTGGGAASLRNLRFPNELENLRTLTQKTKAKLVVVDTLGAHVHTKMPAWGDGMVQQVLIPLQALAVDEELAIVVVTHPAKRGGSGDLMSQIKGSGSIGDAARSVLWLDVDPRDPRGKEGGRRVLLPIKRSLDHEVPARCYEILSAEVSGYTKTHARLDLVEEVEIRERDLSNPGPAPTKRLEAEAFLSELLAEGPLPATFIQQAAKATGISATTLEAAKGKLGVRSSKDGFEGGWVWTRPPSENGKPPEHSASKAG